MKLLRRLFEESADIVVPAPKRPSGWWIMPASYITAGLIISGSIAIFGWMGLVAVIALTGCVQIGHKIGTGRWIDWDQ